LLVRRLYFAGALAGLALAVELLVGDTTSPFHGYFLWHPGLPNLWVTLNLPAIFLGVAMSGNVHQPSLGGYYLGVALQWGTLALLASLILIRPARRTS
jgi:hypothetical protein